MEPMTALGTLWLLVVMQSTGTLQVIDVFPSLPACMSRLKASPAESDGMCMTAFASTPAAKR